MLCTEQQIFRFHKLCSISCMDVLLASQDVLCFMELVCVCVCVCTCVHGRPHAFSHMHSLVVAVGKIMQYGVCVQHF